MKTNLKYFLFVLTFALNCCLGYSQYCVEKIYYGTPEGFSLFQELTVEKYNQDNELIQEINCKNGNYCSPSKDTLFVNSRYYKYETSGDTIKRYESLDKISWNLSSININRKDTQEVIYYLYDKVIMWDTLYVKEKGLTKSIWVKNYGKQKYRKVKDYIYNDSILASSVLYCGENNSLKESIPLCKYFFSYVHDNTRLIQISKRFSLKDNPYNVRFVDTLPFEETYVADFTDTLIYLLKPTKQLIEKTTISVNSDYKNTIRYSYRNNILFKISEYYNEELDSEIYVKNVKHYEEKNIIKKALLLYDEERSQYQLFKNNNR